MPTLKFLTDHGVGLVLLTNGGGKVVEDERARRLEAKLGVPEGRDILRGRVIQSHTPSRGWPEQVKNQTVFITGSDPEAARRIAKRCAQKKKRQKPGQTLSCTCADTSVKLRLHQRGDEPRSPPRESGFVSV